MSRMAALSVVCMVCWSGAVLTSPVTSGNSPEVTIRFPSNCDLVRHLSFSPDGKLLLACVSHQDVRREYYTVSLWLWQEARKINQFQHEAGSYLFLSQSELIGAGAGLWLGENFLQRPEWNVLATVPPVAKPGDHRTVYTCLTLAPCRTRLAAGRNDGVIEIWNLRKKQKLHELEQETWVEYLGYSEDGSYLVSLGNGEKSTGFVPAEPGKRVIGEVIVWDCQNNFRQLGRFQDTETRYVRLSTYTKDGTSAALAFKNIRLTIKGKDGSLSGTSAVIPTLAVFSLPKSTRSREIWLWPDVPDGTRIHGDLAVSPDRKLLAIALAGGYSCRKAVFKEAIYNEVLLFELPNLRELVRMRKGGNRPRAISFSPDGKYLAISYMTDMGELLGRPFVDIWSVDKLLKTHGR